MKSLNLTTILLGTILGTSMVLHAEPGGAVRGGVKGRSLTHEEIARRQAPRDPELKGRTVRREELRRGPALTSNEAGEGVKAPAESLIERSTIISSGGHWTIVPRGAVLHIPQYFESRVDGRREGTLIAWRDFLAKNRGWIRVHEVAMAQARGETPLQPELRASFRTTGLLVVAVCQGGPISVLPPREGPQDPAERASAAEKAKLESAQEATALESLQRRLRQGRN